MFLAKQYMLPFKRKIEVAKDTWTFFFTRPSEYNFFPGQYNRVTLQIAATDDRGNNRQFTISSSPTEKEYITITTKIKEAGSDFKKAFAHLIPETKVQFFGPLGGFYLREENKAPRVFLAGGIGITPFRSMIKYIADKNLNIPIILIASFSLVEEVIFYEELSNIASQNASIKIVYSLSHPVIASEAKQSQEKKEIASSPSASRNDNKFEHGRISELLIKKYVDDIPSPEFMIVGPPSMVDSTVELLQTMKIPEEHIKAEHFIGY